MSMTELEEVQALLEHVLPDPSGFAQRLLLQAMTRWGQSAHPGASTFYPGAGTFHTAASAEDVTAGPTVTVADSPAEDETPIDTNMLLAAALGACECWGLRADCQLCGGQGSAGWIRPDLELFEEFVRPAIARLSRISADGHNQPGDVKIGEDSDDPQTVEGEKV